MTDPNIDNTKAVQAAGPTGLARFRSSEEMTGELTRMKTYQGLWMQFLEGVLVKGTDYVKLPDCGDKVALSKGGGEKVLKWHGYYCDGICINKKEDWDLGLFAYVYRAEIKQVGTGMVVGAAEGECNSWEPKYRYRWVFDNEIPSNVDRSTLVTKTRKAKKTGKEFTMYRLENPDPAGERNTVMKMAFKRAMVDATIAATAIRAFVEALTDDDPKDQGDDDMEPIGGANVANTGPDGYKALIKYRMKSKYGDKDRPSQCHYCGEFHVLEGDQIVTIEAPDGKKLYGPEACLAKRWLEDHPPTPEGATPAQAAETAQPATAEPAQSAPPAQAPTVGPAGAKLTMPMIKQVWEAITKAGKNEAEFKTWLHKAFPKYAGKGINDIEQADLELITQAWRGNLL